MDEVNNLKYTALNFAIKSACGTEHDEMNFVTTNPTKLIEAAKLIETYLKENEVAQT